MRKYELTILAKAREGVVERIEKLAKTLGGSVGKISEMGKKPLAYPIDKAGDAHFFNLIPGKAVLELKKKLAVDKEILRHMLTEAK